MKLIIIISKICNLNCRYCYANGGNYGSHPSLMNDSTVKAIIEFIINSKEKIKHIQFFGGEPTLAFSSIRFIVNHIQKKSLDISFSISTNLVTLSEEQLYFFKEHNFHIVASMDGDQQIHDYLRGEYTHFKVKSNINKLVKLGVNFDIECTYTAEHIERGISFTELLQYFEIYQPNGIQIVPAMIRNNSNLDPFNNNTFKTLLINVNNSIEYYFNLIQKKQLYRFNIVNETLEALFSIDRTSCICDAGLKRLAIDINGDICPCHLFIINNEYLISNVFKVKQLNFIALKCLFAQPIRCNNCDYKFVCTNCPAKEIFYKQNNPKNIEKLCYFKQNVYAKTLKCVEKFRLNNN